MKVSDVLLFLLMLIVAAAGTVIIISEGEIAYGIGYGIVMFISILCAAFSRTFTVFFESFNPYKFKDESKNTLKSRLSGTKIAAWFVFTIGGIFAIVVILI
ncbi:MAG TPA: hypothetical protein H9708_02920 [Candidatus Borkfalkia stercoripullorum]|nr:hypothetical protein [Candidatus Borkfalkia stercoripullorum]